MLLSSSPENYCAESKALLDKKQGKGRTAEERAVVLELNIRHRKQQRNPQTEQEATRQMHIWTYIQYTGCAVGCPTCLAELRGAPALARHANHGLHFGTNAGAPLLVVSAYRADRRVRLAAVHLLQVTHVAADACALGHVHPTRRAHLPVFHFGCKVTS